MHRTASSLLLSMCVLCPGAALADEDDDNVLSRARRWVSQLGKPKPPEPEDLGARNTFTMNPLALRHSQLGLEYERAFGKGVSLFTSPEFAYGQTPVGWTLSLAGTLGLRIFVLGNAPSGIYFGPEFSVNHQLRFQDHERRRAFGVGLGGGVGWTLVLFSKFTVAAGFSAQYRSIPDLETGGLTVQIIPTPRLAFGVAF